MGVLYALCGAFFALCLVACAFMAGYIGGRLAAGDKAVPVKSEEESEQEKIQREKMQLQWDSLFSYTGKKGGDES